MFELAATNGTTPVKWTYPMSQCDCHHALSNFFFAPVEGITMQKSTSEELQITKAATNSVAYWIPDFQCRIHKGSSIIPILS